MFAELYGNEDAKSHARHLLKIGRVPSSFLLAGPDGVGKRLFALELARAFVCTEPVNGEGCGKCSACGRVVRFVFPEPTDKTKDEYKKVFFSEHPDVGSVVPYKRLILVDAIRDLEREANFRPYESKARFFIIDEADKLNDNAANALLKTLEEPPDSTYLILVTSRPDHLLPTIRSRCQMLRFTPVGAEEIAHCIEENAVFKEDEARLVARLANGSIAKAMSFDLEKFRTLRESMLVVVETVISTGDIASLLQSSERMNDAKGKEDYEASIDVLESLVRDIWLLKNSAGTETVTNIDIAEGLSELARSADARKLREWIAAINELRQNFASNINRKVATDALFVKMAAY